MNIKEEFNRNAKNVIRKETSNPDLFVLKYHRNVFFSGKWNDFLRECRGMVIDSEWNIVSLPFCKIHNYGIEESAPVLKDRDLIVAARKVNGFMVAVTWYKDDLLWSTTGSIDSDYVKMAKGIFESWSEYEKETFSLLVRLSPKLTFLFECVHPNDPHIVYEEPGLCFLGCRLKDTSKRGVKIYAQEDTAYFWKGTPVKTVETLITTVGELKQLCDTVKHEGFVFHLLGYPEVASKIKSKHYLTKKFLMRVTPQKLKLRINQMDVDEEFFPIIKKIQADQDAFAAMPEAERRAWIEQQFDWSKQ